MQDARARAGTPPGRENHPRPSSSRALQPTIAVMNASRTRARPAGGSSRAAGPQHDDDHEQQVGQHQAPHRPDRCQSRCIAVQAASGDVRPWRARRATACARAASRGRRCRGDAAARPRRCAGGAERQAHQQERPRLDGERIAIQPVTDRLHRARGAGGDRDGEGRDPERGKRSARRLPRPASAPSRSRIQAPAEKPDRAPRDRPRGSVVAVAGDGEDSQHGHRGDGEAGRIQRRSAAAATGDDRPDDREGEGRGQQIGLDDRDLGERPLAPERAGEGGERDPPRVAALAPDGGGCRRRRRSPAAR